MQVSFKYHFTEFGKLTKRLNIEEYYLSGDFSMVILEIRSHIISALRKPSRWNFLKKNF